jgi:hypothetical protein
VQKRFLQYLARDHEGMRFVATQFDVSVKHTPIGSAHADVATDPCREKEEFTFQKVPFWCPWK